MTITLHSLRALLAFNLFLLRQLLDCGCVVLGVAVRLAIFVHIRPLVRHSALAILTLGMLDVEVIVVTGTLRHTTFLSNGSFRSDHAFLARGAIILSSFIIDVVESIFRAKLTGSRTWFAVAQIAREANRWASLAPTSYSD